MITPSSVIIGHIFSSTASTPAITALKRLYASFVPEDRIVTMDAYSAELGTISAKAVIVQQMMALNSVHMICGKVEASPGNVGWILGGLDIAAVRTGVWMRREVRCLVNLAKGLGMEEVKAYWEGVLKLEGMKYRRDVRNFLETLNQGEDRKKAALILTDAMGDQETALVLLDELKRAEVTIRAWVDCATKEQSHNVLQTVRGRVEGLEVANSLESACAGSNVVILHGSLGIRDEAMQAIADNMERPKALLNLGDRMDEMKMRQLGFRLV
jgi:UDPglucose 6-dehydrogenase